MPRSVATCARQTPRSNFSPHTASTSTTSRYSSSFTKKTSRRNTGNGGFANCSSVRNGNKCGNNAGRSSISHYVRGNRKNANGASVNNKDASIGFRSFARATYSGACSGWRLSFTYLPLTLLCALLCCLFTPGVQFEGMKVAAVPVTGSASPLHSRRIFRWPRSTTPSVNDVPSSPAEGSVAFGSPSIFAAEEKLGAKKGSFKLSPLVTGKASPATEPNMRSRRRSSRGRSTLRVSLLRRVSGKSRHKAKDQLERKNSSTVLDTPTPPVFDSPSPGQKFFGNGFDRLLSVYKGTGFSSDSRSSSSESLESSDTDSSPGTPGTTTSLAQLRRRRSAAFQRLAASINQPRSSACRKALSIPVEEDEADRNTQQQEVETRNQGEKQQQKEEEKRLSEEQQQTPAELLPLPTSSGRRSLRLAQRQPDGNTDTDDSADDSEENKEKLSLTVPGASSALIKKRLALAHRLSLSPLFDQSASVPRSTEKQPSSSPQTPAKISAAHGRQRAASPGAEQLPIDPNNPRPVHWEELRVAVGDFNYTRQLTKFALLGIENACSLQHRDIDELVWQWVAEGALPRNARSAMLSLVKTQTHIFFSLREAVLRCKRTQTELRHVELLYRLFQKSREGGFPLPHTRTAPRETPIAGGRDPGDAAKEPALGPVAQNEAPVDPLSEASESKVANAAGRTTGTARDVVATAAAASEEDSSDDDSGEEFTLPSPTSPSPERPPSLAWTKQDDVPGWRKNTFFTFDNLVTENIEDEEREAQRRVDNMMHTLRLEALSKASLCTAIKEEVSYAYKRLLYWVTMTQVPELRNALLEETAVSAPEKGLISVKKHSSEALSPYIRRLEASSSSETGRNNVPEAACESENEVNVLASAIRPLFEEVRREQFHLDVWLGSLAIGEATRDHVLREIHGLKTLHEHERGTLMSLVDRLQTQQLAWPYMVAAVEQQLQEQPLAFNSQSSSEVLWDPAKELVTVEAELSYLYQAREAMGSRLRFWERGLTKLLSEE